MPITLSDHETGKKYAGNYDKDLVELQDRLGRLQAAHIIGNSETVIVVEGWDAAGKGGIIQRLCAEWDPRFFQVWPIAAPSQEEKDRHFLWRFWKRLPGKREIAVFDRSWYGRVLVERVEGYASEKDWNRGYDEINEFEAQLAEHGVNIIKLFVHVTQAEQDKRLTDRLDDPWKRWKTGTDDFRNRARRDDYLAAYADMFDRTDTRWAPWTVIDGNSKKTARIAALSHIATVLEKKTIRDAPDPDPAIVALAHEAFGYQAKD